MCPRDSLALVEDTIFCNPSRIVESFDNFLGWYSSTSRHIVAKQAGVESDLHYGVLSMCGGEKGEIFVDHLAQFASFSVEFVLASGLREFTRRLRWRRLAFVADFTSAPSLHLKEEVSSIFKDSGVNIRYYRAGFNSTNTLMKIKRQKYKIIIVSLPLGTLYEFMSERLKLGMYWPEYAWIILGKEKQTARNQSSLNEVFVFQPEIGETASKANITVSVSHNKFRTLNYNSNITTICPQIRQKSYSVHIYQVGKTNTNLTNFSLAQNLTPFTLSHIPADKSLETSLLWYTIFSFIYFPVFIVLIITTVLYFKFRNRPGIKATSVSLNVFIFIGCYLLLTYNVALNMNVLPNYYEVKQEARDFMCFFQLWFNGLSIPSALILSVLLVKLVRVYRIFNYYGMINTWECHDAVLVLYVLLLVLPIFVLCFIQSITHRYKSSVTTGYHNGDFIAFLECKNDADFYWLFGQLVYLLILTFLLVVAAIKTRKVDRDDFKDTKKVIALMIAVIMTSTLGLTYVFVFDSIIEISYLVSTALLILSHCCFVMECIVFLYIPKFYPIFVKKKITSNSIVLLVRELTHSLP